VLVFQWDFWVIPRSRYFNGFDTSALWTLRPGIEINRSKGKRKKGDIHTVREVNMSNAACGLKRSIAVHPAIAPIGLASGARAKSELCGKEHRMEEACKNPRVVSFGWSGLFYVPRAAFEDWVKAARAFSSHDVFHEVATPTIIDMIAAKTGRPPAIVMCAGSHSKITRWARDGGAFEALKGGQPCGFPALLEEARPEVGGALAAAMA